VRQRHDHRQRHDASHSSGITVNPTNTGGTYAVSGTITVRTQQRRAHRRERHDSVNDPNATCVVTAGRA